jgi:hypothetical protein
LQDLLGDRLDALHRPIVWLGDDSIASPLVDDRVAEIAELAQIVLEAPHQLIIPRGGFHQYEKSAVAAKPRDLTQPPLDCVEVIQE